MKLKSIYLFIVTLIASTIIFPNLITPIRSNVPVTSGDYFDVQLSLETQSPWTKSIPIAVKFRSNITADKVEISWDSPDGVEVARTHPQFISVKEGEVYTYRAKIKPDRPGTYTIAGNIVNWEVDTNYSSSANITLTIDDNLVVQPNTPGYSGAAMLRSVIIVLLVLGSLFGLYVLAKLSFKKLIEWLKPPE